MNKKYILKRVFIILLLPLGMLIYYFAPSVPRFIEKAYSNGFFKVFAQGLSLVTGVLPVSLAELGLFLIPIFIILFFGINMYKFVRQRKQKHLVIVRFLLNSAAILSIIYFCFVLFWGLNYSRYPFSKIAGLNVQPSSVNELAEVCKNLIDKTNELRKSVNEDENGVMHLKDSSRKAFKRAYKGYDKAAEIYPELGGKYGSPKAVLLSRYMSYTGITGIYCPFTAEANVDIDMPDPLIPSTACHEMAHQHGFAREDEANYIAYLTCKVHPDPDFKYSGTLLALINSMNALYRYDKAMYSELSKLYSAGLVRDLRDNSKYWSRFEGPVEHAADSLNNAYLKANMQKDGVQSYGRMVDLLIAEFRQSKSK